MQYDKQSYIVCNQGGFKLSEALKLWKAKYPEFIDFKKDVITNPSLKDFGKFIEEYWDSIFPATVEEALRQENTETRRTYFDCIGVQKLFKSLDPKLLDRQVITKKRANWDDENKEVFRTFEDVYELYEIKGTKLFEKDRWGREPNPVYAVRCWCTTTNREYWLYVNQEAATGQRWWGDDPKKADAIRAIAWTIRIDVTNPEKIYRQGDIIVVKKSKDSEERSSYHLDKDQYLQLMYSET
jgi:hypothetical protein